MFQLVSPYKPTGDQPQAIQALLDGIHAGAAAQTLLGVTGSGKTFTVANVISQLNRPTLILSHNKTLAAQLYSEMKAFFPHNAVEYFVSYYDYYQPEAYIPSTDTYIEKDLSINEEIDRLRLSATAALLSGRKDVIVISSVSCLYGIGSPQDFTGHCITVSVGQQLPMEQFLNQLVAAQYIRNDADLARGRFRVKGDTVDIAIAYADYILRVEFFGNEVDRISTYSVSSLSGAAALAGPTAQRSDTFDYFNIYPATIFCTNQERLEQAKTQIRLDLAQQAYLFRQQGEDVYADRLEERVKYDLEMIEELGYCSGVENYSRYLEGREPGTPPYCLLDYFPDDMLLIIDESHVTIPQIHAMYGGDKARKDNLINFGFRLPAARDNRPLTFEEFESKVGQTIFLSATPSDYELDKSAGIVIDQLIRPTGLLDPEIDVRPSTHQVDDLMDEIQFRIHQHERVLVTTLTKRMAEELDEYLRRYGISAAYIHSDIDTIERVKIMEDLRKGVYDVLVGVNLLREGLDLPEVSLVAILDADKEGFLRDRRSLIQTIGRAARHVHGKAILYADKITRSMQEAIDETMRRRTKQIAYNEAHHITPQPIQKAINSEALSSLYKDPEEEKRKIETAIKEGWKTADWQHMDKKMLTKAVEQKRKQMLAAAKALDFDSAALLRDEMLEMEKRLQALS